MKVLVINCGSSSLKYQLMNMEDEKVLAKGLVERIGIEGSILTQKVNDEKYVIEQPMKDHKVAIGLVLDALVDKEHGVIGSMAEISAVGHRVVHGGEKYAGSVLIDGKVMEALEECVKLAPLHNPPNIIGINACKELMPSTPMVAVFDTAFHQTLPEEAFMYALPYELYTKYGIRKYGFHGTSHRFVSMTAAELMGKKIEDLKIITCHLGNGASLSAVKGGKSVDTTMGFTPLAGVVMGTRCGDIDPAIVPFLEKEAGMSTSEVDTLMNKKSGVLGVSGVSSDFRDIEGAAKEGNKRAKLALDVFHYRVRTSIGAYAAALNGVDCIVFTAGLGENSITSRAAICDGLQYLGVNIDADKNNVRGKATEISTADSKVKVFVIPTDEELMIARDTKEIVESVK
ncbi:acetate/propionate family kinase [Clostridium thailandense]|uniref:Acetate kinase n=1 Tax=Clostridium thailandense TaxID=2794346 RepID=A0A949WTX1_9CLOT|nr:acetate kinase [Clostridium thailandense]MBV7271957.1 acetate kinase [Clostridium thailandense]MCH5137183.1 acetate kinase [Clostridiaceae bacterium UIB06]